MTNKKYAILYGIGLVTLILIDYIWIGNITKAFYIEHLGFLLKHQIYLLPIFIFYLIYSFGLLFFAVKPAIQENSILVALSLGTLLGLVSYATYNLTNMATISFWPKDILYVDMFWGVFSSGLASSIMFIASKKL